MINFCWSVVKWALLIGLAGAVIAVALLYRRMDEEVRRRVEQQFARHYPDLRVTVGSAELVEGEGIRVRDVSIIEPSVTGPRAEMLHLEEAFLCCRADLNELLSGRPEVSRVFLRHPTVRAAPQPDGSWNVQKLLRLPPSGSRAPTVYVENGTIEILDPAKGPSAVFSLRHMNLQLTPCDESPQPGFGPTTRKIRGTLSGDFFRNVQVEGLVDPEKAAWTVSGSVEDLELSSEMRAALPPDLVEKLPLLDSLRGTVSVGFRAGSGPPDDSPIRFELRGGLTQGRIEDPRLPHPLNELRARFRISNEGLTINDLFASSGTSTIEVATFRMAGFRFGGPMWLDGKVRELELDQRLRDILPENLRPEWDKFLPAGKIHADLKLHYDGRNWKPDVNVQCLDAAFTYYKFPYRLEHVQGEIRWADGELNVDLEGQSGSRAVHVKGNVVDPAPGATFSFEVTANDLPLDNKLFAALQPEASEAVCALNPRGAADITFHCYRKRLGEPAHKYLHMAVKRGWICYDNFPYPLGNITGVIERNDDRWDFRQFQGTNDTGRIFGEGRLDVTPEGNYWELRYTGTDVPLEEELRDALSQPNMKQLWDDLRVRGMVDFEATVRRLPQDEKSKLTFLEARLHGDTTSIEPVWFPYEMRNLQGTLIYDGQTSHVSSVGRLEAVHRRTTMRAEVDCNFLPDGGWRLCLGNLSVDRLDPDRELIAALRGQLREAVVTLKPSGPVNLNGTLELAHGGFPDAPFTSQWNLEFLLNQGSVDVGVKLENLHGGVKLAGTYDGQRFHARGELGLDSLTFEGVQFTRVMGPMEIEDNLVLLGSSVRRAPGEAERKVTAQLFDGSLCGNGRVVIGAVPKYQLNAFLTDGDLSSFAQELVAGHQQLRGRIGAWVRLWGEGRSLNGLGGLGRIELRDADIYELPLMIALLKILGLREPDQTAFSTSDIDFHIHGGHVYLTNITFNGDAFSLEGSGVMDFDNSIRLTFRGLPGRREWHLPVFRELLGRASEEIMVIHVGGTLQDPIRFREPFPGVNEALRQLQRTTGASPLFPEAEQRMMSGARRLPRKR